MRRLTRTPRVTANMSSEDSSDERTNGHDQGDEVKDTVEASDHSINGGHAPEDEDGDLFGSEDEEEQQEVRPAYVRRVYRLPVYG